MNGKKDNDNSNYKAMEGILYSVPKLRTELELLKLDLEEARENDYNILSKSGGINKEGSQTYAIHSGVESEAIRHSETINQEIASIKSRITQKERQLKRIEIILVNNLTDEQQLLIEMRYFKHKPISSICEILNITSETFHTRRKGILIKILIPLFFAHN